MRMLKKEFILLASCGLLFVACENPTPPVHRNRMTNEQSMQAGDQGDTEEDRTVVQKIRDALSKDPTFTSDTRTIRIISSNGVVTLRGTVLTEQDKNILAKKVKEMRGVKSVDNQVEVSKENQQV